MKKYFFLASCAALALCSCSNEIDETDEIPLMNSNEIRINTYTPGMTRAEISTAKTLQNDGFFLYATEGVANDTIGYVNGNYVIATNNSGWSAVEDKSLEWPLDPTQEVEFCAMYGAGDRFTQEDGNPLQWRLDASGESDMLVAYTKSFKNKDNGTISLQFKHILTKIAVEIKKPELDIDYVIEEVSYEGPGHAIYDFANANLSFDTEIIRDDFRIFVPEVGTTLEEAYSECGEIFAIPHSDYIITIKYNLKYSDGTTSDQKSISITKDSFEKPFVPEAGNSTKFQVTLPSPDQSKISINVSVDDWGTETTKEI